MTDVIENVTQSELPETDKEELTDGEDPVVLKDRIRGLMKNHWHGIVAVLTPIVCLFILVPFPAEKYQWCGYTLVIMAIYWVTECIPVPVTSFLPIVIFPLAGVMDTTTTCGCYYNNTVFMFLGSLILASCVEQSGLHVRLALCAIRKIGYSHYRLLFAISFITMFVSMWVTNTAATTMMIPITFALLRVFEGQGLINIYDVTASGEQVASDISTCYFCAATFSATIGGIGTLVGTATNLVFKGLFEKAYLDAPEYLSFPQFSAFSIPYMLVLEALMYLFMILYYFGFLRPNSQKAKEAIIPPEGKEAAKNVVESDWQKLGKITFWEIMVIVLFSGAMFCFFARSPQIFPGWGDKLIDYHGIKDKKFIQDSACAMLVAFLMFLLPSTLQFFKNFQAKEPEDLPPGMIRSVLDWKLCHNSLPWSFVFLLGGGFALSTAAKKEYSDLNGKIGEILSSVRGLPNLLILLILITFTVFLTNFASNVAVCNVIAPIAMQLAQELQFNPLWYNIAAGFSASFCFCVPVGTPGNLIVQSAANIPTSKMIKAGSGPTIITIFVTWVAMGFWAPVIWPDLTKLPDWEKVLGEESSRYDERVLGSGRSRMGSLIEYRY